MSDTSPLREIVSDIVHEETQSNEDRFDITVSEVYQITDPGRIDFGGGEFTTPMIEPVATTRRNADDTYEWWYLDHGQYIVEYNESLSEDTKVIIQPHPNLLQVGGVHPTYITDTLQNVPLVAPTGGLRIKENARISTLYEYPNG